jgi:hypothetical protein
MTPAHLAVALWLPFFSLDVGRHQSKPLVWGNSLDNLSRRIFVAGGASTWIGPATANAVPPVTKAETDSLFVQTLRRLRPKPPKLLRSRLNLDFAVMLMRTSYNACDDLDVIAMNQFQRDFFLIRSAEYETYVSDLGSNVQQGDLTDPNYFDFISYAQYHTINRALADPAPFIFEEDQPIKASLEISGENVQRFESVLVRRNIANDELSYVFDKTVGQSILDWMIERYGGSVDLPRKLSQLTMTGSFEQLVKLFVINGYAWSGNVSEESFPAKAQRTFCFSLESPTNLWSAKALAFERSKIDNNFLGKVILEWLRGTNISALDYKVRTEGNLEKTYVTVDA